MRTQLILVLWGVTAALAAVAGCGCETGPTPTTMPASLEAMLPAKITIHPFTGTRTFSDLGGINGIDMRVQAFDRFGDATKAFGTFRFELYRYEPREADPRGERIGVWAVNMEDPKQNLAHWDNISRIYQFRLGWDKPIPVGEKFVVDAVFSGPYGPRLFDRHIFLSGD